MSDFSDGSFIEAIKQTVQETEGGAPYEATSGRFGDQDDLLFFTLAPGQTLQTVDLGQFAEHPWQKTGHVSVTDPASFVAYVNRHRDAERTTLWGDRRTNRVVGVLDDHGHNGEPDKNDQAPVGRPYWGRHRVTLALQLDEDWALWLGNDGKLLGQEDFADFLEQAAPAVHGEGLDTAVLYEIATSLRASKGAQFQSAINTSNGEVKLGYEETITARAGQKGDIEIPKTFSLVLPIYEGGQAWNIEARFVYRIHGGDLKLGYRLLRKQAVIRAAFQQVVAEISQHTGLPVFAGIARSED